MGVCIMYVTVLRLEIELGFLEGGEREERRSIAKMGRMCRTSLSSDGASWDGLKRRRSSDVVAVV